MRNWASTQGCRPSSWILSPQCSGLLPSQFFPDCSRCCWKRGHSCHQTLPFTCHQHCTAKTGLSVMLCLCAPVHILTSTEETDTLGRASGPWSEANRPHPLGLNLCSMRSTVTQKRVTRCRFLLSLYASCDAVCTTGQGMRHLVIRETVWKLLGTPFPLNCTPVLCTKY